MASAQAQEAAASGVLESSTLEEIIVTAAKREQNLQDVPLSISAMSGDAMTGAGIGDLQEFATRIPGLAFRNAGPGRNEINIRGISSAGGRAPTVGFYIDETPVPAAGTESGKVTIDPNFFDLARAEVLRGPQGTLYGSSSLGGTVKLVTNQPDPDHVGLAFDATVSGQQSDDLGYALNAMLNAPLVEQRAALRLVGFYTHEAGFIDRVVTPTMGVYTSQEQRAEVTSLPVARRIENVNDVERYGGRALLRLQVSDQLSVTPSVFVQRVSAGGSPAFDSPSGKMAQYQPLDIAEPFDDEFRLYNVTAEFDGDAVQIVSSTSYFERDIAETEDSTETFRARLDSFYPQPEFIAGTVGNANALRDFSQELRISSRDAARLEWVAGAFFQDSDDTYRIRSEVPGFVSVFGYPTLIAVDLESKVQQAALFGEINYHVTQQLTLTGGLRWFDYTAKFQSSSVGVLPNLGAGNSFDTILTDDGEASERGITPKVSASYEISETAMIFATVSKGFRPGAANAPIPSGLCDADFAAMGLTQEPAQYDADSVINYELGAKTDWLERRLQVNASIYHIDWQDIQQRVELACGFQYQDNLGEAHSSGLELEIAARPTPNLGISLGASYTEAELDKDVPGAARGQRVLNVPKQSFSASFDYSRPLGEEWRAFTRGSLQAVGDSVSNFDQPVQKARPSYELVNVRLGLATQTLEVALFADNLLDEEGVVDFRKSFGFGDFFDNVVVTRPRTLGLTVRYTY